MILDVRAFRPVTWGRWLLLCLLLATSLIGAACQPGVPKEKESQSYRIAVLLSGDVRLEDFRGFKDGLRQLGYTEDVDIFFEIYDANDDRTKLPVLAQQMVESQPDLAVAAGGIEADALKVATAGTDLPVLFLAVSSPVDRGLVDSLVEPGGNLTGVDTNDTQLTAKRLEYIHQLFPQARRVHVLVVPSITPAVESLAVAEKVAPGFGLELVVTEVETEEDIQQAAALISAADVDVMLLLPAAPVQRAVQETLLPVSRAQRIPIMGVNREDVSHGAVAGYAASRYDMGMQSARLAQKLLSGVPPKNVPVETPDKLEFVINRTMVEELGLTIPDAVWGLVDDIVRIDVY